MTGHTISTRKEINETVYNYRGINILVVDKVTVNNEDNSILKVVTHYECNFSIFYKLEEVEDFVKEVFFSGDDAITPTDKIEQSEVRLKGTEYPMSYKKDRITKDAIKEGLNVTFINKNAMDLVVYRENGCTNVVYVSPLETVFNEIIH